MRVSACVSRTNTRGRRTLWCAEQTQGGSHIPKPARPCLVFPTSGIQTEACEPQTRRTPDNPGSARRIRDQMQRGIIKFIETHKKKESTRSKKKNTSVGFFRCTPPLISPCFCCVFPFTATTHVSHLTTPPPPPHLTAQRYAAQTGSEFISLPVRPNAVTDGWILCRLRLVARR